MTKVLFELPLLPYPKNALEPYISEKTLTFHHEKHHQTYVTNLNNLIANTEFDDLPLEGIIIKTAESTKHPSIFNNAAQVWNHTFYWKCMQHNGGGDPRGELAEHITTDFGSLETFLSEFKQAALTQFGSGWAWLAMKPDGKLIITKTGNADCPIAHKQIPLLTIDVWEHAYYLDYQNLRADYTNKFIEKLINWDFVEDNYAKALRLIAA
jgi:Fe-Mn family superoxide dismutase